MKRSLCSYRVINSGIHVICHVFSHFRYYKFYLYWIARLYIYKCFIIKMHFYFSVRFVQIKPAEERTLSLLFCWKACTGIPSTTKSLPADTNSALCLAYDNSKLILSGTQLAFSTECVILIQFSQLQCSQLWEVGLTLRIPFWDQVINMFTDVRRSDSENDGTHEIWIPITEMERQWKVQRRKDFPVWKWKMYHSRAIWQDETFHRQPRGFPLIQRTFVWWRPENGGDWV
jgi:hypothetical protein